MLVRNLLIATVTAPELLVAAAVWVTFFHFPHVFIFIGGKLVSDSENWKYVTVVPTGLFVWCATLFGDIRNPLDKEGNKLLYSWPNYKLLVGRLYFALALSGVAAAGAVGLWLLGKDMDRGVIGALFVGAFGIAVTVAATLTFARARLRELLTELG